MKRWTIVALLAVISGLGLRSVAWGFPYGQCGVAEPVQGGCSCHQLNLPSTRLFILGLPGLDPALPLGYSPDQTYDITVMVFGPPGVAAGFNLAPDGGTLAILPGDDSAYLCHTTECVRLQREGCLPGFPGNDCGVKVDTSCPTFDPSNPACVKCGTISAGVCRPCDNVVDLEPPGATHSRANPLKLWKLRWTAPGAGSGPVRFYLAGNSVLNLNTVTGTIWSQLGSDPTQPVIVVPEGGAAPVSSRPLVSH